MKHAAHTRCQAARNYWLQGDPAIGQSAFRLSDMDCLDCWLGFIYTMNGSSKKIRETLTLRLEGLDVLWPALQQH